MRILHAVWFPIAWSSSVLAGYLTFLGFDSPVRTVVVLLFILVCPGMAIVRLLRIDDPIAEVTLAVAMSLTLAGFVAGAGLYAGLWSPDASLAVLIAITVVVSAVPLPAPRAGEPR